MKTMRYLLLFSLLVLATLPSFGAEEDSIAAVYAFGRTGSKLVSGFAVGDGSWVVTSIDYARETVDGKPSNIPYAVIVSRWTGDAYVAKVAAVDEARKLALLKLPVRAFPALPIAASDALSSARNTSLGDVLSGSDAGTKFPSEILALKVSRKPDKFVIGNWKSTKACIAEVGSERWLFLSGVTPEQKVPDAAVIVKRGVGVLGVSYRRIVVTGGSKQVTYYRALSAPELTSFLAKSGATTTGTPEKRASDAEMAFQAMCLTLSASISGSPAAADYALAASKARPKSAPVQMLLGNALLAKGKPAEALKAVETAVSLDPAIPDADLMLGYAQAAAGKADDAEKSFRKSISATPGDLRPSMALVRLLVTSGKRDAARAEIHTLRQTKLPADAEEALRKLESQLEK